MQIMGSVINNWKLQSAGRGVGGLWLVASSKIKISFAEYSLFYRALLQKKPIFEGSLLIVATHSGEI